MSAPPFSEDTPNKIGNGIDVSGKHTLTKTENENSRVAIANEPIDAKVDGKKMFCVRVDNAVGSYIMIGFTPMETFDSTKEACFGSGDFNGTGMLLRDGDLHYPVDEYQNIIDDNISEKAKEIIAILEISNNGKKKEIRFLVDGNESKSSDVSEHLQGDFLFPAIFLHWCYAVKTSLEKNQQITTIPIHQIEIRTPEIDELIYEYRQQKQTSNSFLQQHEELARIFLQQREVLFRGLMARMKLEIEAKR
jgi:hypothetical protein